MRGTFGGCGIWNSQNRRPRAHVSGVARIWTWDSQLCTMLGSFFETPIDETHLVWLLLHFLKLTSCQSSSIFRSLTYWTSHSWSMVCFHLACSLEPTLRQTLLGTDTVMVARQSSDSPYRFPSFVYLCWIFPSASSSRLFPRVLSSTFTHLELDPAHFSHSGVLATVHLPVTSNSVPRPPTCLSRCG